MSGSQYWYWVRQHNGVSPAVRTHAAFRARNIEGSQNWDARRTLRYGNIEGSQNWIYVEHYGAHSVG